MIVLINNFLAGNPITPEEYQIIYNVLPERLRVRVRVTMRNLVVHNPQLQMILKYVLKQMINS